MKIRQQGYQKNFSLIIAFFVLISVALIGALIIAYNLTSRYVQNEFAAKKIDVLEQTMKPYEDLYLNKVYEITSYQGFLDSTSAAKYSASVFQSFPFVKRTVFYDIRIGSQYPVKVNKRQKRMPVVALTNIYEYKVRHNQMMGIRRPAIEDMDFRQIADKFSNYIQHADTAHVPTQDEVFKVFYDIKPDKISYLNIPRREEIKAYRNLLQNGTASSFYKQNMMTFYLDPYALQVKNTHPELYQHISIKPVVYDPLENESRQLVTDIPFPGAFSDYKLYFQSSSHYLQLEVNRRFMPTAAIVVLIYLFLVLIGWLIYRNLSTNLKIFKLQYDFINNFTHEFKTPVSVIKIAGSNLRSEAELTERQRKHYGRILDEEADKLNDLMNKLLSFTQIENRSIKLKRKEINIREFVNSYIETFRLKYPDFKIEYELQSIDSFYTDPVLLGSIFQNLIENAYKYSHPQHKELFISVVLEKRNIVFTFIDKGIGIPKNEIKNIFKKFYRIENKYNQNGSVGLGLAFCKELANFMNGDITLESELNKGSRFTVTLPYES